MVRSIFFRHSVYIYYSISAAWLVLRRWQSLYCPLIFSANCMGLPIILECMRTGTSCCGYIILLLLWFCIIVTKHIPGIEFHGSLGDYRCWVILGSTGKARQNRIEFRAITHPIHTCTPHPPVYNMIIIHSWLRALRDITKTQEV